MRKYYCAENRDDSAAVADAVHELFDVIFPALEAGGPWHRALVITRKPQGERRHVFVARGGLQMRTLRRCLPEDGKPAELRI